MFGLKTNKVGFKKINKIIWFLTFNDVSTWGAFAVVNVLVGLYISQKLGIDGAQAVGIGTGIAYFVRGLVQIPFGVIGDSIKSLHDELLMLVFGNLLFGFCVLSTVFITDVWQFYLLQVGVGVGSAMNLVDWRKLFATNLDKGREGMEYAVYDTVISFSIAALGIFSGSIAGVSQAYFDYLVGGFGIMIMLSNLWLIPVYYELPED
jgi:MFS family permease